MKVFDLVKDRFGMGSEPVYYQQDKAQRIAAAAAYFAQEVFVRKPLRMSAVEFYNAALISRTVHRENEGIYNGKEAFDFEKNQKRGKYSILVAQERGVKLSEVQKEVIAGEQSSLEADIIKLAEAFISVQYQRVQAGQQKAGIKTYREVREELHSDSRMNSELLEMCQAAIAHFLSCEGVIRAKWECSIIRG